MGMRGWKMNLHDAPDQASVALHTLSLGTIAGVMLQVLPVLAVLLPVIYYAILIWESKTFSHWRNNRRQKRAAKKVAKLKAKAKVIQAKLEAEETVRHAATAAAEKVATAAAEAKTMVVEAEVKSAEDKTKR